MATQIVMDHTSDIRHVFDAADENALSRAEECFKQLTRWLYSGRPNCARADQTGQNVQPEGGRDIAFPRLIFWLSAKQLVQFERTTTSTSPVATAEGDTGSGMAPP